MSEPNASRSASKPARSGSGFSAPSASKQPPAWTSLAALALSVVAVVVGLVGWFKPSTGPGKFSDAQKDEAKTSICAVQNTVRQATGLNTNMPNPNPGDAAGELAVAANARLALYGGGGYLRNQLEATPATPDDLAKAAGAMAGTMQTLGINYLAGHTPDDPVQQPLRDTLKTEIAELDGLCQQ